jgi:hypothetical protein
LFQRITQGRLIRGVYYSQYGFGLKQINSPGEKCPQCELAGSCLPRAGV